MNSGKSRQPIQFQIHYLKSQQHREMLCQGAVGGLTPNGRYIAANFYSERGPIPRTVEYEKVPDEAGAFSVNEALDQPSYVDSKNGVVRSVELTMYFDLETMQRMHEWFGRQIEEMKKAHGGTNNDGL